jgi:hypothetical protein
VEYVRRPLSIALVIWLGLLWVGSPAFACARAADRDCCPAGGTSPCHRTGIDLSTVAAPCCVAAPAASPTAVADANRTAHVQPHTPEPPDVIAAFAWFATLSSFTDPSLLTPPDFIGVRPDAALTYLQTLRLRL